MTLSFSFRPDMVLPVCLVLLASGWAIAVSAVAELPEQVVQPVPMIGTALDRSAMSLASEQISDSPIKSGSRLYGMGMGRVWF